MVDRVDRRKVASEGFQQEGPDCRVVSAKWDRSYGVHLVSDLMGADRSELLQHLAGRRCLLVTTPSVAELYGRRLSSLLAEDGVEISTVVLPVREESKSIENVLTICREAQAANLGRQSMLIGLGGGVCTDMVTLAAQLLRRGIPYIRIPTTLLGQVDGSIGVKGAVNFNGKKNSLGCYYSPKAVFVDSNFLRTLPERQLSLGVSEIIKMAIVRDRQLFELVEQDGFSLIRSGFQKPKPSAAEISQRSILGMIEELETNLYEDRSYQRLVDFGHTVGPALEAKSNFKMAHGDAVAISMAFCCQLARELGWLDDVSCERALRCIGDCDLPVYSPLLTSELVDRSFNEATSHRAGQLNLVLPTRIGAAQFVETKDQIPATAIQAAIGRLDAWPNASSRGSLSARKQPAADLRSSSSSAFDLAEQEPTEAGNVRHLRFDPIHTAKKSIVSRKATFQYPDSRHLVFDVGGTNTRAAIYDEQRGVLVRRLAKQTPNHRRNPELSPLEILSLVKNDMEDLATELLGEVPPQNVSVAFAGPLDGNQLVVAAPTIWGTASHPPIDLVSELQMLWPTPTIRVINDVTASGYRHLRHANENLCVITVGSGIGNKVFVNGKPMTGVNGRGGEIGHIVVDHAEDALLCDCGGRGHLGGIASGRGTLASAKRWASKDQAKFSDSSIYEIVGNDLSRLENQHIVNAFHQADQWTHQLIRYVAGELGNVIAQMHQSIGIERFVLFGGFAIALGEVYRECVADAASEDCWDSGQNWSSMIELGLDEDDSGLLGVGRYAAEFADA